MFYFDLFRFLSYIEPLRIGSLISRLNILQFLFMGDISGIFLTWRSQITLYFVAFLLMLSMIHVLFDSIIPLEILQVIIRLGHF